MQTQLRIERFKLQSIVEDAAIYAATEGLTEDLESPLKEERFNGSNWKSYLHILELMQCIRTVNLLEKEIYYYQEK